MAISGKEREPGKEKPQKTEKRACNPTSLVVIYFSIPHASGLFFVCPRVGEGAEGGGG